MPIVASAAPSAPRSVPRRRTLDSDSTPGTPPPSLDAPSTPPPRRCPASSRPRPNRYAPPPFPCAPPCASTPLPPTPPLRAAGRLHLQHRRAVPDAASSTRRPASTSPRRLLDLPAPLDSDAALYVVPDVVWARPPAFFL
ncbi:wiskott-Aldrich syndrome protein family member 2-like [Panicum virgatum]|uniref:wiskott-Aldrich syndrome protein family member 2-like n=1 Tax=Panicum virgatum TaxID=38727 RepID=UPI0019D5AF5A|nr:wiskott-Aldrich syndrome protein family member 2-like [Panicum virgatum]